MRVALVCPYSLSWPGGVQSHVLSLARHLCMSGHEAKVFAPIDGGVPEDFEGQVVPVGRSIPIPANKSISRLSLSPTVIRRIAAGFATFEPEVAHIHEPLQAGVSLYALLRRSRPPVVGSFHAAAERMPFYDWLHPLFSRLLRRIDVAAAVSPAARELIRRHFGEEVASRIRILPNGIDISRFESCSLEVEDRDLVVLFVGRLEKRKGCDVLLDAWSQVADRFPDWRLIVVGEGPLRHELEAKTATIPGVEFRGRVGDAELLEAYASARIVCVPSVASESFGIVILEAMASGACVVASDLFGYRWVGGDAASYFTPGDPVALAERIQKLIDSPELAAELSAAGRKRAAEFEWSRLVPDVVTAYEDAVRSMSDRSTNR
jgi:phosphatidylinositol alpha-mannosyltransferase